MASTDVPVEDRQMAAGEYNLRPHLIHFNRSQNILLDGFSIRESPFWTIHLYMCEGGGVRNIYMHDCAVPDTVFRLFFVKTNHRRGAFVENIYMENIEAGSMQRVLEIDTDVLYQWRDLVPTYEERLTKIDGIYMRNVTCKLANAIYELKGDPREPVGKVVIENVHVAQLGWNAIRLCGSRIRTGFIGILRNPT